MKEKLLLVLLFLLIINNSYGFGKPDLIFSNGFEGNIIFEDGFDCDDFQDTDNDRLLNCFETNTNIFVSSKNTGTDPNNPDSDNDGINDGDEVLGTIDGLDLPSMGLNPLVQNLLIEYDWFDDDLECAFHSHRPTENIDNSLTLTFLDSPNINPDGSTGIVLIQDYGQGGVFSGGNFIDDSDGVIAGGVSGSEFHSHKQANFANNRNGYFHYTLLPHRYNTDSGSSGQAEVVGDDLIVSLYCFGSNSNVSKTILHELGHNLSLRHGGNENCNYKPNYSSVMNYKYQFPGADDNCDAQGDGVLDYSRGSNMSLDETNLDETLGFCNNVAIDWNLNSVFENPVIFSINSADANEASTCGGTLTTISDHNDWQNINLLGIQDFDRSNIETIECNNPPIN